MAVLLHAVPLAGVCRKERSSPVPQVRARPEEMRCVGSKRTPEVGRDMLLAASIVKFSGTKAPGGNRTVWTGDRIEGGECSLDSGRLGPTFRRTAAGAPQLSAASYTCVL